MKDINSFESLVFVQFLKYLETSSFIYDHFIFIHWLHTMFQIIVSSYTKSQNV